MSRPPRLSSFDYVGGWRYFLTICSWQRSRVFTDAAVVDLVWDQFRYTADEKRCDVLTYCFMPDHAHLLVSGGHETADFKGFVRLSKQRSGWRYKRGHDSRLWQDGYYERVLRQEESLA